MQNRGKAGKQRKENAVIVSGLAVGPLRDGEVFLPLFCCFVLCGCFAGALRFSNCFLTLQS